MASIPVLNISRMLLNINKNDKTQKIHFLDIFFLAAIPLQAQNCKPLKS